MKHLSCLPIENSFSIKIYLKQTKQLITLMFPHYVIIFFKKKKKTVNVVYQLDGI